LGAIGGAAFAGPSLQDPFVRRFYETPSDATVIRRGANIPTLRGRYEDWRSFIEDAVRENAAPSRELIAANEMLAAWEAHLRVDRVSSFPVTVGFSFTDICNARCVFCAYVPERVVEEKVSLERLERADWLRFCKNYTPNGGGLGEPFAHPNVLEIIKLFRQKAPYLNFGSITNASLLRDRLIDEIVGYVTYLYVSINSARKETYEKTMSPLQWDKLIDNLTRLKAAKERAGTALPRLRCGYVVHTNNLDELPEAPALLASLGFTDINVNFMTPPPHSESRKLYTDAESVYRSPEKADAAFRKLEAACAKHNILLVKPLPSLDLLRRGVQVAVPEAASLPREVNRTTGFFGISTGRTIEWIKGAIEGGSNSKSGAAAQTATPPVYDFATYNALHRRNSDAAGTNKAALFNPFRFLFGLPRLRRGTEPPLIIDEGIPKELANDVEAQSDGISYEWVRFAARKQKAFCWAPWRMLKIDIFDRTLICCNFFGKLPEFEWPTAQDFHRETGMWNHPFMQHLRRTMDTAEELAYCTFCKTSDKRHMGNTPAKTKAKLDSLKVYNDILNEMNRTRFTGEIDARDIQTLSISIGGKKRRQIAPFSRDKNFYRNLVRRQRFVELGRIVQLGVGSGSITPFLAEAGNALTLADPSDKRFALVRSVCDQLGVDNIDYLKLDAPLPLPFEDARFDGVWLEGKWLRWQGRQATLLEIARILRPGGRLHVSQAPCVGDLVDNIITGAASADSALSVLRLGSDFAGPGSFVSMANVLDVLDVAGFDSDKTLPPQAVRFGGAGGTAPAIGGDPSAIAALLDDPDYLARLRTDRKDIFGLERFISFTAVRRLASQQTRGPTARADVSTDDF